MTISNSFVYILTNKLNSVFYIGVTTDLVKRIWEHKNSIDSRSFTSKYATHKLVYYEQIDGIQNAIDREKHLKGWLRIRKIELIESMNKEYKDLFEEIKKW